MTRVESNVHMLLAAVVIVFGLFVFFVTAAEKPGLVLMGAGFLWAVAARALQ